jgi:hypothetical protein
MIDYTMSYPTTVDRPDLQTADGHPVGVQYPGGDFVDKTTGQVISTSDTHTVSSDSTHFSGYDGGGDGGGDGGSSIVEDVVDAIADNCLIM